MLLWRKTVKRVLPEREKNSHIFSSYTLVQPAPKYFAFISAFRSSADSGKGASAEGYMIVQLGKSSCST